MYAFSLAIAVLVYAYARTELLELAEKNQWLVNATCDAKCAQLFLSISLVTAALLLFVLSPLLWAGGFYFLNHKRPQFYHMRQAMRSEAVLLAVVGVFFIAGFIKSGAPQKYYEVVAKYQAGTLLARAPAADQK